MRAPRRRRLAAALACIFAGWSTAARCADSSPAQALLEGRVHEAEQTLRASLASNSHSPANLLLLCRVLYAQDRFDEAQKSCEDAAAAAPGSSAAQLWLGRAYGARASAAGRSLAAFALARKVHAAFAEAVRLDAGNLDAKSDLGEFYVTAPPIVGGGVSKARELAPVLLAQDTVRGHRLLAQIARKENDPAAAERESEAAAASGTSAGLVDLALFRWHNRQPNAAVDAVRRSIAANRLRDDSLVDAATVLTALHRESQLAVTALRSYLASPAKTDAAPAFKVHLQLAALLRSLGDDAGAARETAAAAALAPEYTQAHLSPAVP